MSDLLAARYQMAISLGFHIIFACIGIAMPFFMAVSHWKWLKTQRPVFLRLTKAWSRGVAIFFAVGAVSGTVLSFELGLLWPRFMREAGALIGMPFSWEGTAFFVEAIALGLFLYGWDKMSPWIHWGCGLLVGISGVISGLFVVCANGWMNTPVGFEWVNGEFTQIDPVAAMFNPSALIQGIHMTVAAFQSTGFAVAGLHGLLLLKQHHREFHLEAMKIALLFGAVAALIQPLAGDFSAKHVARTQPAKLAAMENLEHTQSRAPLKILGLPIPGLLSFLAYGDFDAEVKGLREFEDVPPAAVVHFSFQVMIIIGSLLAVIGLASIYFCWKKPKHLESGVFLRILVFCTPLGFIATEAGWVVTEVGRQPWIIQGYLKTKDALTPMPGIVYSFIIFTAVYLLLTFIVFWILRRQIINLDREVRADG